MTDFALPAYGWSPRRDQMPLWRTMMRPEFRQGVIVGHRRFGKDELGLQLTCIKAMQRVGSYWYCLPQYNQARKTIWEMVNWRTKRARIDDAFPPEIVTKRDNQSMMLWLASGSTVQLIGSDQVDSLVGGGQLGIVLSEAALSRPEAMQYFRPILEESGGWELQISTPRGKNHFYHSYLSAKDEQDRGDPGAIGQIITARDSSVFAPDQLDRIRRKYIRDYGHTMGTALFEQEFLCSFHAAIVGAVWGAEVQEIENEGRIGAFGHDRRYPVFTSWDIGVADPTVILFWQEIGSEYRLIDAHESTNLGLDSYVEVLRHRHNTKGYHYAEHIAPHDVQQREWAQGASRMAEAARMGLHFKRTPQTRQKTQIAAAAQLLRQVTINEKSPDAVAAYEHWKAYHFAQNTATKELLPTPVHDEHSHASSAMMTYAVNRMGKLGFDRSYTDEALHGGSAAGGKFDPRVYDRGGAFGGGGIRTRPPRRGVF